MKTIELKIQYEKRKLQFEVKHRGGAFNAKNKTWTLPDTEDNRALAHLIDLPLTAPTPEERIHNVAQVAVALCNEIKHRKFHLVQSGDTILIESQPLPTSPTERVNPATDLQ
jgi:hypothetical protein